MAALPEAGEQGRGAKASSGSFLRGGLLRQLHQQRLVRKVREKLGLESGWRDERHGEVGREHLAEFRGFLVSEVLQEVIFVVLLG